MKQGRHIPRGPKRLLSVGDVYSWIERDEARVWYVVVLTFLWTGNSQPMKYFLGRALVFAEVRCEIVFKVTLENFRVHCCAKADTNGRRLIMEIDSGLVDRVIMTLIPASRCPSAKS